MKCSLAGAPNLEFFFGGGYREEGVRLELKFSYPAVCEEWKEHNYFARNPSMCISMCKKCSLVWWISCCRHVKMCYDYVGINYRLYPTRVRATVSFF